MRCGLVRRSFDTVSGRTAVFIYASDPISAAGAKMQLQSHPSIEIVGPADLDRARVALLITDSVDETAAKVVRAIQRDGIARVVLVAARFDESGVLATVAAGVTSFLRRSEATSLRLAEVLRQADQTGCQLPEGLLRKAAISAGRWDGTPTAPAPVPAPAGAADRVVASRVHSIADVPVARSALGGSVPGRGEEISTLSAVGLDPGSERSGSTLTSLRLSSREMEVLRLVADGFDTADIAEKLSFSESTIKGVLAKVMSRLEARNRCHAVAIAVREGLL